MKNKFSINKSYLILGIIGLLVVGGFIGYNYQNSQNEVSATGGRVNLRYTNTVRGITAYGVKISGMSAGLVEIRGGTCQQYALAKGYQNLEDNVYIERNGFVAYTNLLSRNQYSPIGELEVLKALARYNFIACVSDSEAVIGDVPVMYVSEMIHYQLRTSTRL